MKLAFAELKGIGVGGIFEFDIFVCSGEPKLSVFKFFPQLLQNAVFGSFLVPHSGQKLIM